MIEPLTRTETTVEFSPPRPRRIHTPSWRALDALTVLLLAYVAAVAAFALAFFGVL